MIAAKEQFGIRIVNASIGAAVYESYDTDLLTVAAKLVVDSGMFSSPPRATTAGGTATRFMAA